MAVAALPGGGFSMVNGDVLNNATVGDPRNTGTYKILITGISFVTNGTAPTGVTTLKTGGSSGPTIWSGVPALSDNSISFAEPIRADDFACSAMSTNVTAVIVHVK